MPFRHFENRQQVVDYATSLDDRWPERTRIAQHIRDQIAALPFDPICVVELCPGPGKLAHLLLEQYSALQYTGIDISGPLLAYAQERLAAYQDRTRWIEADLNEDEWIAHLPRSRHAFVSMQSLHDLGDQDNVARMYSLTYQLLPHHGRLIVADLLPDPASDANANPGRLPIQRHLHLLNKAGFSDASCTLHLDGFGCFSGEVLAPQRQDTLS